MVAVVLSDARGGRLRPFNQLRQCREPIAWPGARTREGDRSPGIARSVASSACPPAIDRERPFGAGRWHFGCRLATGWGVDLYRFLAVVVSVRARDLHAG